MYGMNKLMISGKIDKSIFTKTVNLIALRVPSKLCQEARSHVVNHLFQHPRYRSIQVDPQQSNLRLILLDQSIADTTLSNLPSATKSWIYSQSSISVGWHSLHFEYDDYSATEVFRTLLPSSCTIPNSFEQVGHIVHINLEDSLLPYKYLIGQVFLDKIPGCKTVVNKVRPISSPWRTFDMELLAGDDNTEVVLQEGNCTFAFDYRKVYWNSRLRFEHSRLINTFSPSDVVADMFCGVGPFAIPAGKRGCSVYANDLNPDSYKALLQNCIRNHVENRVFPSNLDAREFILSLGKRNIPITQIIMNLPSAAEYFCDVFNQSFGKNFTNPLPRVHCYMFSNKSNPIQDSIQRLETILHYKLSPGCSDGKVIREVSPHKFMTLVSFDLKGG